MRLEWQASIPREHPALAGHFPGHPIVPGVVLLDAVAQALARHDGRALRRIGSAKFLRPVAPGEVLDFVCEGDATAARFSIRSGAAHVASGTVGL